MNKKYNRAETTEVSARNHWYMSYYHPTISVCTSYH